MAKSRRKRTSKKKLQEKKVPKAYGYIRVSTDEQAAEGISLDVQEEKIRAYATLKDFELVELVRDEGRSGKDLDRPGLQRLLQLVEGNEAEALIVYKLDRLTRRTSDLLHLVEEVFEKGNTRFLSITEQIDTDTAMGKFFLTIMGAMAQMERELISERTSAALSHKKDKGEVLGQIPYGFERDEEGKLLKNREEQNVIRRMKRLRKNGKSYQKIANALNEKGVKPRQRQAKWYASSVRAVLVRK